MTYQQAIKREKAAFGMGVATLVTNATVNVVMLLDFCVFHSFRNIVAWSAYALVEPAIFIGVLAIVFACIMHDKTAFRLGIVGEVLFGVLFAVAIMVRFYVKLIIAIAVSLALGALICLPFFLLSRKWIKKSKQLGEADNNEKNAENSDCKVE